MFVQLGQSTTSIERYPDSEAFMNRQINVYDAKAQFSQLVQDAAAGEEIVIAKSGKPVAKLVPYQPTVAARQPGAWRGRVRISPDFDKLPQELEAAFCGKAE